MLPTKFLFIWQSSFRGEDFQKSTNQKQELPVAAIFVNGSGRNEQSLQRTSNRCILPSFGSFGKADSEEKMFQKSSNQKQELSMVAIFVNGSGRNEESQQRTFHRCCGLEVQNPTQELKSVKCPLCRWEFFMVYL